MQLVTGYAELQRVVEQKKLAAIIGVEGGHMIEENLACLDSLYARGARYLTLTWNNSISWASSAQDEVLQDRKSVVEGKSVSVRLDLGGRRFIKKKKRKHT